MVAIEAFIAGAVIQMTAILILGLAEWLRPAARVPQASIVENIGIGSLSLAAQILATAFLAPLTIFTVNRFGGGLWVLPLSGAGVIFSAAVDVAVMDFGEYLFHRAQHRLPILWAMHSLHHSDVSFGAATAVRHFWLESWLKSATIWLAVGCLIKAPPAALITYSALGLYNFVTHSNLALDFGRASWLFNAPSYHRVHHSRLPEHDGYNFAALLPIFDWFSGTYLRPTAGVYPATGLSDGKKPRSIWQAALWPLMMRV
jgi:sterol desaturase/sphingolipid hydroxylase (fatty acid hydroxylase superfamily)